MTFLKHAFVHGKVLKEKNLIKNQPCLFKLRVPMIFNLFFLKVKTLLMRKVVRYQKQMSLKKNLTNGANLITTLTKSVRTK